MTDIAAAPELDLAKHRGELTGYCYRMLGSATDADDAVQETLVRAWRSFGGFEGRSAVRSWLYRIATNVCFDVLNGRQRRARPMDMSPAKAPEAGNLGAPLPETTWIQPIPDSRLLAEGDDPADVVAGRESVRLAFVAALQHLPPRQRAVLILREVLHWKAEEVARLLDTSVPAVNSALQRARATLAEIDPGAAEPAPLDPVQRELVDRYVDAFERYDIESLVALLHDDATMSMPPYALWLRGHDDIAAWHLGPGAKCRGSRLIATSANGSPAFGQYRRSDDGGHEPWALQVLEITGDRIVGLNAFLDTATLFPLFGLPSRAD
jgi:RNA polymerase sigma-70 factor (ECF subfamily)